MHFPTTVEGLTALLSERMVFDIGQIPADLKRWLAREVKKGRVQRMWNCQLFPRGKTAYWIAS